MIAQNLDIDIQSSFLYRLARLIHVFLIDNRDGDAWTMDMGRTYATWCTWEQRQRQAELPTSSVAWPRSAAASTDSTDAPRTTNSQVAVSTENRPLSDGRTDGSPPETLLLRRHFMVRWIPRRVRTDGRCRRFSVDG